MIWGKSAVKFNNIIISKWNQFENINIAFNNKLTILTGANGCGKTTILGLLARHQGWNTTSLATPHKIQKTSGWSWLTGWAKHIISNDTSTKIGNIGYSDGSQSLLSAPKTESAQYEVKFDSIKKVECFYIPSHRNIFKYEKVTSIPTQQQTNRNEAFIRISESSKAKFRGDNSSRSANFHIKEILLSWNIFGYGNKSMEANDILLAHFQDFESILKTVLPKELGFNKILIRNFEIVLSCDSGEFLIDAASGGISSLIDMAWQIHMYSANKDEFTVLVDEIENHLHPTMQRRILTDFINAFPKANFIVSTHSPLIVNSVKDASLFVLKNNSEGKVESNQLDFSKNAKTATEILDSVLGVSFTMPIWAEDELNKIIIKYQKIQFTETTFSEMRNELANMGLENLVPNAIAGICENK